MLDRYLWSDVERISPEAPVPVAKVVEKTMVLGGAANVAANLIGLKLEATLLGVRGADLNGRHLQRLMAESGISDLLVEDGQRPTTCKTRVMAHGQQLLRLDEEQNAPLPPLSTEQLQKSFAQALDHHQAVIISDYGKGVCQGDVCQRVVTLCRQAEIPVIIDPKGRDWNRYRQAYGLTPNLREFEQYLGSDFEDSRELDHAAQEVRAELGLDFLLITRGAKGMTLVEPQGGVRHIEAQSREVFDVSGAGDTVIAVFAAGLAAGLGNFDAARLANLAAGVVVGKLGTQPILLDELEKAMEFFW
jgi:D-beta-D-heptose 7-phosphate kinase/D-beta-D-heptose 1-phosphate adenosyltransferase